MSDSLTDDHVSWAQQFTGVTIGGGQPADAGSTATPAANGSDQTAASNGADQSAAGTEQQVAAGDPHAAGPQAGDPHVAADPQVGDPHVAEQTTPDAGPATSTAQSPEQQSSAPADAGTGQPHATADGGTAAPGGILDTIGDGLSAVGGAIADGAKAVGGAVVDGAKAVGGAIEDGAKAVAQGAEVVGGAIVDGAKAVGGALEDGAKAVGGALEDGAKAVGGVIEDGAKAIGGAIEDGAVALGRAVGLIDPPKPPEKITPPILGPEQQKRADDAKTKLPPEDQKKYQDMLDGAKSDKEKQYLQKGLAAGHSLSELQAFQSKIAGKDEKWMQDNLALTGNSEGKGVKQQWSMSCNATTAEAVRGQMDPLYALKMHEDNPDITDADNADPTKKNDKLAADQKAQLESANPDGSLGGQARARDDTSNARGRWNTDLLNKDSDSTGMKFDRKMIGGTGPTVDQAVDDISSDVEKGMPVPIVIGDGGAHANAHYVLVTAVDKGPPKAFSIHDPGNGTTEVRTEDELKNGKIDLAGDPMKKGSGWNKLSAYEKPTPVAVK
jgi:hypothetical protein